MKLNHVYFLGLGDAGTEVMHLIKEDPEKEVFIEEYGEKDHPADHRYYRDMQNDKDFTLYDSGSYWDLPCHVFIVLDTTSWKSLESQQEEIEERIQCPDPARQNDCEKLDIYQRWFNSNTTFSLVVLKKDIYDKTVNPDLSKVLAYFQKWLKGKIAPGVISCDAKNSLQLVDALQKLELIGAGAKTKPKPISELPRLGWGYGRI